MPGMLSPELVGRRVVLRYRHDDPSVAPPFTDAVGTLVSLDQHAAVIRTRDGERRVPRSELVLARAVAPSRREILDLERIARLGWRGAAQLELDGWQLYADQGWTGRANSALPLATGRRPLPEQLADVQRFYSERGLLPQIQVPLPARSQLDTELARRNWQIQRPTLVLTRELPLAGMGAGPADEDGLRLAATPDDGWLGAYHYRGGRLPAFAQQLLTRHDRISFASIRRGTQVVAIGRGAVDEGWLGITAVEVEPRHRRQGLARAVVQALAGWAVAAHGARVCYLQLDESNTAAHALYTRLGFTEHHRYHYRVPSQPTGAEAGAGSPSS